MRGTVPCGLSPDRPVKDLEPKRHTAHDPVQIWIGVDLDAGERNDELRIVVVRLKGKPAIVELDADAIGDIDLGAKAEIERAHRSTEIVEYVRTEAGAHDSIADSSIRVEDAQRYLEDDVTHEIENRSSSVKRANLKGG